MIYRSLEQRTALLVPPPLSNSTCPSAAAAAAAATNLNLGGGVAGGGYAGAGSAGLGAVAPSSAIAPPIAFVDVVQAIIILLLSVGILAANLILIIVINSRQYAKYIHKQPRYLLTSLASNDLAMGLLVTPFALLPSIYHCWPYGEIYCQIQALLRGALSQQSAIILICMAMDRYMCVLHPNRYQKLSGRKVCVALISVTWAASLAVFALLVLPRGGYYFNSSGLLACDPFYSRPSLRILASCSLYFPTTMVLMYCYGSAFHVNNKLRLKRAACVPPCGGAPPPMTPMPPSVPPTAPSRGSAASLTQPYSPAAGVTADKIVAHERRLSTAASRTMAAMSLGFIVVVTPWTIQEVVAACTGSKVPPFLDFIITWLALSNSFWNPFLYWLLNNQFRRISRKFVSTRLLCRRSKRSSSRSSLARNSFAGNSLGGNSFTGNSLIGNSLSRLPPPPPPPRAPPPPPPPPPAPSELEDMSLSGDGPWGELSGRAASFNSLHRSYCDRHGHSHGHGHRHVHTHDHHLVYQHRRNRSNGGIEPSICDDIDCNGHDTVNVDEEEEEEEEEEDDGSSSPPV